MALVAWDVICRPTNLGGLGVLHLPTMNLALLTKWVARFMGPGEDLVKNILHDCYGSGWQHEGIAGAARGVSLFWHNIKKVLSQVREHFTPNLVEGSSFKFWTDDWSGLGSL